MIVPQSQSGMVMLAVVVMLTLIPAAVLLTHERMSAMTVGVASQAARKELNYLLDAAIAHARYFADQNQSCSGFIDLPATSFDGYNYTATITQHPTRAQQLSITATAILAGGDSASRTVWHTAYQAPFSGDVYPSIDLTVTSYAPTTNFATDPVLTVAGNATDDWYTLMHFPLAGLIDRNIRLNSATLNLSVNSLSFIGNIVTADWLFVHPLSRRWSASATWDTADGNKSWRPGGLGEPGHPPTPIATFAGVPLGQMSVDITESVHRWIDAGDTYYGVLLKTDHDTLQLDLDSTEAVDRDSRPALSLDYACPCGVTCLVLPARVYRDPIQADIDPGTGQRTCDVARDYRGSNGDLRWTFDPWVETGDDGDSCTGTVKLNSDPVLVDPARYQIKFTGDNDSMQRKANLENAEDTFIRFRYRREGTTSTNQQLTVRVANDGAWNDLLVLAGDASDSEYQQVSVDVPDAMLGPGSVISFFAENLNDAQHFYVDDVEISFKGPVVPNRSMPVVADAYLREDSPTNEYVNASPVILRDEDNKNFRIVVHVDTDGLYPAETIGQAKLRLWIEDSRTDRDSVFTLFALDEAWDHQSVTWRDRERNLTAWLNAGGTFTVPSDPAQIPTVMLASGEERLWLEFDITSMVQQWSDLPDTNHGLVLLLDDTGRGKDVKITSIEEGNPSIEPHVELTW